MSYTHKNVCPFFSVKTKSFENEKKKHTHAYILLYEQGRIVKRRGILRGEKVLMKKRKEKKHLYHNFISQAYILAVIFHIECIIFL